MLFLKVCQDLKCQIRISYKQNSVAQYEVRAYLRGIPQVCIDTQCLCIQMCMLTRVFSYSFRHPFIHTQTQTQIQTHTYTFMQVHTRKHTHTHAHTHTHTQSCVFIFRWQCSIRPIVLKDFEVFRPIHGRDMTFCVYIN